MGVRSLYIPFCCPRSQNIDHPGGWKTKVLDCTFPVSEGPAGEWRPVKTFMRVYTAL